MATITDESNLFGFIHSSAWEGQYSASWGSQDFAGAFTRASVTYVPTAQIIPFNTNAGLTHGFTTYFKMQGYNESNGRYEVWFSETTPLLIPPSGNRLSNISIVLTWIDR
jgi:hypothetical protein